MTGKDIDQITGKVLDDVSTTIVWCNKWRMKLSIPKTEVTLFSRHKTTPDLPPLRVNTIDLNYNKNPRLLGIHLDEKFDFKHHISKVEEKALKSLRTVREVRAISNASSKTLLRLYTSLIQSIMEYACFVWSPTADISPHARKQRKALALCLGLPSCR